MSREDGGCVRLVVSLLLSFILIRVNCIDALNNTACVIASKTKDGSYDFSLEEDASLFYRAQRKEFDFEIPAAVWFNNSIDQVGLAFQTVKTSGDIDDSIQAYWAGYLELHVSRNLTRAHFENTWSGFCKESSEMCVRLKETLIRNLDLSIERSLQSGDIDPYWHQMELILWQLRGLVDGWNNVVVNNSKDLTPAYLRQLVNSVFDIYLLQMSGDLSEVTAALGVGDLFRKNLAGLKYPFYPPSCSALIKILPGQKDAYVSQVTWQGYASMLKIIKYYEFAWKLTRQPGSPFIPSQKMLFSSYPSTVASIDDYYTTGSGLAVLETTNGNSNPVLWPHVRHGLNTSVLEVFRVMIANRLARTPIEWISFFTRENSGTYNNQWMIFDSKKFEQNKSLPERDLLWVAEQIPGLVMSADVTDHLRSKSYWASYNNPYFEYIFNVTGNSDKVKTYGDWFDYDKTPRAQIFKRDHGKVDSLPSMFRLMRYNNFKKDPLARCNCTPPFSAENAIAARSDLNDPNGTYPFSALKYRLHGATDVKLVNIKMIKEFGMIVESGPTYEQVPVFEWSKTNPPVNRPQMHPDRWDFPPLFVEVENYRGTWVQPYLKSFRIGQD